TPLSRTQTQPRRRSSVGCCWWARGTSPSLPPCARQQAAAPRSLPPASSRRRRPGSRARLGGTSSACWRECTRCLFLPGAEVYFQVDCTQLKECVALSGRQFDRVVFNFPHCGRKAGVRKNRTLLTKFFLSCAGVLSEDGEVHIALCNGQGGTPADQPMREWHNSWQVVAMAAEAGFILSEICPFDCAKYHSYRSTGYRSQDKTFHVEGALNHIFTRSLPFTSVQAVAVQETLGKHRVCFQIPEELSEYMNRGFLGRHSHHPVNLINERLLKELSSLVPVQRIERELPLLFHSSKGLPDWLCDLSNIYWIRPSEVGLTGSEEASAEELNSSVQPETQPVTSGEAVSNSTGTEEAVKKGYGLRSSLMVHAHEVLQQKGFQVETFYTISGPVFRKIPVSRDNLPAFHETLLICGFDPEQRPDYIRVLQRSLEKVIPPRLDSSERLLTFQKLSDAPVLHGISVKQKGERQVGWIAVIPPGRFHPGLHVCAVTLNLDLLAMLVFGVQDWRMLWSSDPRFLDQFCQTELRPLQSFSLHPPLYQHDVSFWVDPLSFDELGFHSLVRQATAGAVIDVRLVDSFQYPHMPQASRCYRLSYQACDRALSSRKAQELQLRLREQIQQRLQVTLR
ncbi:ferredoxin-fold anticodon-binding domain-containing protein 1-like isoform X1, partial [Huso huso]